MIEMRIWDVRIPRKHGGENRGGMFDSGARTRGTGTGCLEHVSRGRGETGNARRTRGAW